MKNYKQQAADFLKKHGAKITITKSEDQAAPLWHDAGKPTKNAPFKYGLMYDITITRGDRSYSFNFWDSIANRENISNAEALKRGELVTISPYFGQLFSVCVYVGTIQARGDISEKAAREYVKKLFKDYEAGEFIPNDYDILATITKHDPGTFADFCAGFGYNEDSRTAEKTYFAVIIEYKNIERLFGDCMEELQEIN